MTSIGKLTAGTVAILMLGGFIKGEELTYPKPASASRPSERAMAAATPPSSAQRH
jgi:hypothetical protein